MIARVHFSWRLTTRTTSTIKLPNNMGRMCVICIIIGTNRKPSPLHIHSTLIVITTAITLDIVNRRNLGAVCRPSGDTRPDDAITMYPARQI